MKTVIVAVISLSFIASGEFSSAEGGQRESPGLRKYVTSPENIGSYVRPYVKAQDRRLDRHCATEYAITVGPLREFVKIKFPANGVHPTRGAWTNRMLATRCGSSVIYNYLRVAEPSGPPRVVGLAPGMTMVDPVSQRDIRRQIARTAYQAYAKVARRDNFKICDLKAPKAAMIVNTTIRMKRSNPNITPIQMLKQGWRESWVLRLCQRTITVPANFRLVGSRMLYTPVAGGVAIDPFVKPSAKPASAKSPCDGLQLKPGIAGSVQPFFGCQKKTARMRKSDDEYLKKIKKLNPDRKASARHMIKLGWKYVVKRDYDTAMRRFNQVWLLNSENPDILHGFAVTLFVRDNNSVGAEILFKRAISNPKVWSAVRSDYARFLLKVHRPDDARKVLKRALSQYPKAKDAYMLLANAEFELGNQTDACKFARMAASRNEQRGELLVDQFCKKQ